MDLSFAQARQLIDQPRGMDEEAVRRLLALLLAGRLAPEQGGELLGRWRERGETGEELAFLVRALWERATPVLAGGPCLDLCGTGGSGLSRFNVSTAAAFLLADAGVRVAKHGNRGSLRPNGSFDLLEALGVPIALPPPALTQVLRETNLCFLFARALHPAVGAAAPYRKAAGGRTIFNLAGPLANPCRPTRQIIGAAQARTAETIAAALVALGTERALVVCGEPGIDEISVSGTTCWIEICRGQVRRGSWRHPTLAVAYATLPGGDAAENARTFAALAEGHAAPALQAMVVANAAAALDLWQDRPVFADDATATALLARLADGGLARAYARHRAVARALEGSLRVEGRAT